MSSNQLQENEFKYTNYNLKIIPILNFVTLEKKN